MILEFQSKLKGEFNGWCPTTIYELKNGTKWMLVHHKNSQRTINSPKVEVYRDGDDYYLKVAKIANAEKVRRVM
ncbi:MAG: hypothetical protein KJP04_07005 [Arenicella sp.]|nr:hypothetical protein [Arenicella sp.]